MFPTLPSPASNEGSPYQIQDRVKQIERMLGIHVSQLVRYHVEQTCREIYGASSLPLLSAAPSMDEMGSAGTSHPFYPAPTVNEGDLHYSSSAPEVIPSCPFPFPSDNGVYQQFDHVAGLSGNTNNAPAAAMGWQVVPEEIGNRMPAIPPFLKTFFGSKGHAGQGNNATYT
jgi:hypothetical protein